MNIGNDSSRPDTTGSDHDDCFDHAMRALHAQALIQVSPQVRTRLRTARTAATTERTPPRGWRWVLASGCAAVFALAIGLQWQLPSPATNGATPIADSGTAADGTDGSNNAFVALDENPDLYLWLASNDDTLPVAWER